MPKFFRFLTTGTLVFFANAAMASDHGAAVFKEACATCHLENLSAEATETADDIAAPPMNLLTTIIRNKTGNSETAFVAHVVDFTTQPAKEKVKAMSEAVDRFGLMPPIGDTYPTLNASDLKAVATWLFSHYDYEKEKTELEKHQ